ncbi:MAG: biotin synthase BioB [Bacteroidota bacterium]
MKKYSKEEIKDIYNFPLLNLIYRAATVHRTFHNPSEIQVSSLLSVKTGGCTEDCGYCSQSVHHQTDIDTNKLISVEEVVSSAVRAKENGASRMCLGTAWREVKDNGDFDKVLKMIRAVTNLGMEVCCTLGMLTEEQAKKLADAGLYAYNHNLDSSKDFYKKIITTRKYDDRLNTIKNIRKAKITVCCGGIIGMGEGVDDRIELLYSLSCLEPQPESVPINALIPVKGTPLENRNPVPIWDMVRMIATARIVMPKSMVRLSAGRTLMTLEGQALCFLAGANSIFAGEKLLTAPNPEYNADMEMFKLFGLSSKEVNQNKKVISDI